MIIKNIEKKKLEIIMQDKRIILPTDLKEKIEKNWENAIKSGANIWNGEVSLVSNIIEDANKIKIVCSKTDYAHYLYGERVGLPEEYSCPNLSGGAIIETSDNYYIIGELEKSTSYPRMLTLSGENIDVEDINCGCIDIIKTISRECTEEINIGLEDKSKVRSFKIKYICIENNEEQPGVQIFAKVKLNITAREVKENYDKYLEYLRENNLEVEFEKIYLIEKENVIKELSKKTNPKRNYLVSILKEDSREDNIKSEEYRLR